MYFSKTTACLFGFIVFLLFQSCKKGSEKLQDQIEIIKEKPELEGEQIHDPEIVSDLYETEEELPFEKWNEEQVKQMLQSIENISSEGLNPEDYHINTIKKLYATIFESDSAQVGDVEKLELLLTDSFVLMASHLSAGKTDSEKIDPQWKASKRNLNLDYKILLDSLLENNKISQGLIHLTPVQQEYKNLKKALKKFQVLEKNGGWENFHSVLPKIEKGDVHEDVIKLRKRLATSQGNFLAEKNDSLFDETLHAQVIIFQEQNGLTPDGIVGKGTIEAMNIPVEEKIAKIEANLERWRWLNDNLGMRRIMVNIANFELQFFEDDKLVLTSKAIVGKPYRKTPVFSSKMSYLVLAPTWTIPPTILKQDVVPAVAKNLNYLKQKNMRVLRRDGTEVNPSTIDWNEAAASGKFPYMIQQGPGNDNAMGDVKFMFPNEYSVYIHDTPSRELFSQTQRSFSSGCIRISKPMELATYLLRNQPEWTPEQITKTINQGKPKNISIKNPIPVHILYLTVWADEEGNAYFRKDIYNRDKELINALKKAPPKPEMN